MFLNCPVEGSRELCIFENSGRSFSCVDDHRALLSAAESDIIGLAVPERRKSASLTELMNESCTTTGEALMRLAFVISGSGEK